MLIKGFKAERKSNNNNIKIDKFNPVVCDQKSPKVIEMRESQKEVFNKYRNKPNVIVRKPPGSGKSTDIKYVFGDKLTKNKPTKLVISVSQNIISASFKDNDILLYPNGEKINWKISPMNDLSNKYCNKIELIVDFLKKTDFSEGIHDRILICSHVGLVEAFKRINNNEIKNTFFAIDEAHHASAPGSEEENKAINQLGNVVKRILDNNDGTCGIWFTTATFFRGDGVDILSEEDLKKFVSYFLPLDKHFESLKYIKTYSYDFVTYSSHFPEKELISFFKDPSNRRQAIIYVPSVGSKWASRNKSENVKRMENTIHKPWKEARILDLVTEQGRDERKKEFLKNRYNSGFDVILAVDLFDEGTDWPEAVQVLDLAPSNSLRVANQRFGRLLRDEPGKEHIAYYVFFNYNLNFKDIEPTREILTNNFAALSASFMIEDNIAPVKLPYNKKVKNKDSKKNIVKTKSYFQEAVPDENQRHVIMGDVCEELLKIRVSEKTNGEPVTKDDYINCIKKVLKSNGVKKNFNEIITEIHIKLMRRIVPSYGVDMSWIVKKGFDKISFEKQTDYICKFVSGKNGREVLKEFRDYYNEQNKTVDEWVKIAEEIGCANYEGKLDEYMKKYRKACKKK